MLLNVASPKTPIQDHLENGCSIFEKNAMPLMKHIGCSPCAKCCYICLLCRMLPNVAFYVSLSVDEIDLCRRNSFLLPSARHTDIPLCPQRNSTLPICPRWLKQVPTTCSRQTCSLWVYTGIIELNQVSAITSRSAHVFGDAGFTFPLGKEIRWSLTPFVAVFRAVTGLLLCRAHAQLRRLFAQPNSNHHPRWI